MRSNRGGLPGLLLVGLVVWGGMVTVAVLAPFIWSETASALTADLRAGPSSSHLLGTDALGRDQLARTLVATRLSMVMAALATLTAVVCGLALGAGVTVLGRRARLVGERLIDLLIAFPPIIVALGVVSIYQRGAVTVLVAVGVAFTPQFARLTNRLALSVRGRDYVTVAQLLGVRPFALLRRHIVPNLIGPLLVLASVGFASSIIAISGLSFLGVGIQEPSYDWGSLLSQGLQDIGVNPIEVLGPAVGILVAGLAAGLVADGLSRYLDPRSRPRRVGGGLAPADVGLKSNAGADINGEAYSEPGVDAILKARDVRIWDPEGIPLVRGVSLDVGRGEIVGIVGESGSGKSLTTLGVAGLIPRTLFWSARALSVCGTDMCLPQARNASNLAKRLGFVFQDPSSSFNPARRIGSQLTEVARVHGGLSRREAQQLAIARLREVQVSAPERRMHQYPHELSGGQRQRAMIAMALMTSPTLLIADEPTTALDVTTQASLLRLFRRLNVDRSMAILLISHNIGVVATLCDRVAVMYAGRVVEEVGAANLRERRVYHPYTRALLAALPPALEADGNTASGLSPMAGRPPRPGTVTGCAFAPRCPLAEEQCRRVEPRLDAAPERGRVACHVATRLMEGSQFGY